MPEFPSLDRMDYEQSLNAIITSIAMEEAALSHILNAEGEKLQYVISRCAGTQEIIKVNDSVTALIEVVNDLQLTLKSKLRLVLSNAKGCKDESNNDGAGCSSSFKGCKCNRCRH